MIPMPSNWRHSRFQVLFINRIGPEDDALDWLAAMGSDIPVKVGQTACQYGFSGNTR